MLQFTVIVLVSIAASYSFQHTETVYQINGVCFYRYFAYGITVVLGYVSFSHFKKYVGFVFSFALSAVAVSPLGQEAIELFPLVVPFLAVLMGVFTILLIPSSQGKGFFEFLVVLILPAILAASRIGGSFQLLATTRSIGYPELSVITATIVGGFFYLRYAALANSSSLKLLSNGGDKKDVAEVSKQCNIIAMLITISASGIAAFLMVIAPIVASVLRATIGAPSLCIIASAIAAGIAMTTIFYIVQLSRRETAHAYY